ncbi:hypothetical protein D9M72_470990 [compost metagenome]
MGPHSRQPWQQVLALCQFYLRAGIGSFGPLGKNIQDKVRTVQDLAVQYLGNVLLLRWRKLVVKNNGIDGVFFDIMVDFVHFSRP